MIITSSPPLLDKEKGPFRLQGVTIPSDHYHLLHRIPSLGLQPATRRCSARANPRLARLFRAPGGWCKTHSATRCEELSFRCHSQLSDAWDDATPSAWSGAWSRPSVGSIQFDPPANDLQLPPIEMAKFLLYAERQLFLKSHMGHSETD